jgi:SAM-dependent methyltransferase
MTDNSIEITGDEFNVEEIMEKIRAGIRRKQLTGEFPPVSPLPPSWPAPSSGVPDFDELVRSELADLVSKKDIRNTGYAIKSHHAYIGPVLVRGRRIINNEVRRYVDPVIAKQREFNESTETVLADTLRKYKEMEYFLSKKIETFRVDMSDSTMQDLVARLEAEVDSRADLAYALKERAAASIGHRQPEKEGSGNSIPDYILFEARFRGSREEIKSRQMHFLPHFRNSTRVLDIGCGRGEFLEILKENDIHGSGVDIDPDMVSFCQTRGFEVECADAVSYLERLDDDSLDGIFIDQVVEHLEPDYLIRMLTLCHRKLRNGYSIVIETVNPLSFVSLLNFFIDLSHKRPVHPETLQFLVTYAGFRECEKVFLSPVPEDERLRMMDYYPGMTEGIKKIIDTSNLNNTILNSILLGAQDYAVIAKK